MTLFAQASRAQVIYIPEVTYGTTPATPTMLAIPFVNFNVNATIDQHPDTSVRADRMHRYSLSGNTHIAGDLQVALRHSSYDSFFESLCASAFSTNVLTFGTTQKSLSLEAGQLDTNIFLLYTGVVVDKLALTVNTTGVVDAKFSVLGKAVAEAGTTAATSTTPIVEAAPFVHVGGTFKEGGTTTAIISALVLNVDNKITATYALGSGTTAGLSEGMVDVTGTVTAYFPDAGLANKFLGGTATSLDFTLTDGVNTMEFLVPNVKYTGANRSVSGTGPVMLTLPFVGLYDASTSTVLKITRSS